MRDVGALYTILLFYWTIFLYKMWIIHLFHGVNKCEKTYCFLFFIMS